MNRIAATPALYLEALRSFRAAPFQRPWILFALVVGVVAVGIDAYTTYSMMASGLTEEANSAALSGMTVIGRDAYIAAASMVSMFLVSLVLVRPVWLLPRALVLFSLIFIGAKLYIGLSNVALWASLV